MGIENVFKHWSDGSEIEWKLKSHIIDEAEGFLSKRAEEIYNKAEEDADQAFVELLQLVLFFNTIISKKAGIIDKLAELIEKFKKALGKIAEKKMSDSFSISAGFPLGVSVGLSWNTPTT